MLTGATIFTRAFRSRMVTGSEGVVVIITYSNDNIKLLRRWECYKFWTCKFAQYYKSLHPCAAFAWTKLLRWMGIR